MIKNYKKNQLILLNSNICANQVLEEKQALNYQKLNQE